MATPKQLFDVERGQNRSRRPAQRPVARHLSTGGAGCAETQQATRHMPKTACRSARWADLGVSRRSSKARPVCRCAGCGDIRNAAKRQGRVIADRRSAQPGDIVLFRWGGNINDDSYSDHVGIVELNLGRNRGIQTIEYNTGNGRVMRRTRSWSVVQYIIRPVWSNGASDPRTEADEAPY